MTRNRPRVPTGVVVGAASAPIAPAVWWWCGLFGIGQEGMGDDHLHRPVDLTAAVETAIGVTATAVAVISIVILTRRILDRSVDPRWWRVTAASGSAAAYVGFTYHAMTAPVIGANIGGALLLLVAPVVVLPLMLTAAFHVARIRSATHR